MKNEQINEKDAYSRLKVLISKDEVLLLVHKKYKGFRKLAIYSLCGMSFRYFEKAYKTGKVILQFGEIGPRVSTPVSWQEALSDYIGQRNY